MHSTNDGEILTDIQHGIATLVFHHPASNSLPGHLLNKLADAVEHAGRDNSVKVIVLKSTGEKAFCAGASFDELMAISNIEEGKKFFGGFARVINAMRKAPVFVICRVQGKTVGGGVGLAAAADYCFAVNTASVKLSELAVGIGPFVVGPAVERKLGLSAMSQLSINATEWQPAEWAQQKGLYNDLFSSIEEMDSAVNILSRKLADSNPEAMMKLKQVFWYGTDHWDELLAERAAMSGELVLSDFTRDAISAFRQGAR